MGTFNLAKFRTTVASIARTQYFKVDIDDSNMSSDKLTAWARSTTLPSKEHETLNVPFRGLDMKIDSKPTFAPWTVTFLADEAHTLRNTFAKWMAEAYNITNLENVSHTVYKSDAVRAYQLDSKGKEQVGFHLFGAFPSTVGQIDVNQEGGAVQTFDVTFTYDYFIMGKGTQIPTDSSSQEDVAT